MRKIILSIAALCTFVAAQAQTLNVNQGSVTYAHAASQAGDMTIADSGKTLTIQGRSYTIDSLTGITVDATEVADNTVSVVYSGSAARVVVAGNIAQYVSATVSGADVTVTAADNLEEEVTYTLSGSSTNGSFTQVGSFKATIVLDALTLTSTTGAPVYIDNGKRIKVKLSGVSTLADAATGTQNACFYCDGHTEFSGMGTLNISGNAKHGLTSDEYMEFKNATLNILSAVGDGLHVGQYFLQESGTISISAQGDGIDIGAKKKGGDYNGQAFIQGGTLTVTTSGTATKGLKADALITVTGGNTTITTSGSAYYDATEEDISSSSAVKTNGGFTMSAGTMTLTSTGSGGKGLNATEDITISGGTLTVVTTGTVFTYQTLDTKSQGVKTDDNINITGGTVLVAASANKATAFKADLLFRINGGLVMGIGNKKVTPASSSSQGYANYSGVNVKGGSTVSYDGVSFAVPAIYNNSAAAILVSSPSI